MPGKRQHYVPKFMLRRFGTDPGDKGTLVWRLDKKSGKPERVNPHNEAVIGRYYRMTFADGSADDSADKALDAIENEAADVIRRVAEPRYSASAEDVMGLLLFALTLKQRTPRGREATRKMDTQLSRMQHEVRLQDREHFYEVMKPLGESEEQLEQRRLSMLEDLHSGRVEVKSTPSREVWLMMATLLQAAEELFEKVGCLLLRAPDDGSSFVLSDHPVAHYDPDSDDGGSGFLPGRSGGTLLPLDPAFALVFVTHSPGTWMEKELAPKDIDEQNLLTYAWAQDAIYGPSQKVVTDVRRNAKRNRALVAEFAYKPPRLWIAETSQGPPRSGWHTFKSSSQGQTEVRRAFVRANDASESPPHG
jgi:Protein of unknown function (DUF4238)